MKMKVLILGGSGMLGHKLWQVFAGRFDTYVTLRQGFDHYRQCKLFDLGHTVSHVSVEDFSSVVRAVEKVRPNVVVNCIGIVKQSELADDPLASISVNALFPHQLAQLCLGRRIRVIHVSTDCVFSGRRGSYKESDISDAGDLYGRTKFLGELNYDGCLTLRTSMVGRELATSHGLLEWFLSQEGKTVAGVALLLRLLESIEKIYQRDSPVRLSPYLLVDRKLFSVKQGVRRFRVRRDPRICRDGPGPSRRTSSRSARACRPFEGPARSGA